MNKQHYEELNTILADTFNEIKIIEDRGLKKLGQGRLSIVEFHLIECIGKGNDGKRTVGEIAEAMSVTLPTVTVAVNKLEEKGYITKSRSSDDKRVIVVALTDEGRRMNRLHTFFHEQMIFAIKNEFSDDEMEDIIRLVTRLNKFFRERTENMKENK